MGIRTFYKISESYPLCTYVLLHCAEQRLQYVPFTFGNKKSNFSISSVLDNVCWKGCWLIHFGILFILAFSSSVRCSVLVLMTTFTLFTLKTWEKYQNRQSLVILNRPCKSQWLYIVVQTINKSPTSVNLCFKSVDNFSFFTSPAPNPRLVPVKIQ